MLLDKELAEARTALGIQAVNDGRAHNSSSLLMLVGRRPRAARNKPGISKEASATLRRQAPRSWKVKRD